jgi:hypothetical protein
LQKLFLLKKESHERSFSSLQTGGGLRGFISWLDVAFRLMAALVLVLVMPFAVNVLMGMSHALMAVLMAVVGVRNRLVSVLMFMLVFIVAAHQSSLLSLGSL